jgi:hypothetical protein
MSARRFTSTAQDPRCLTIEPHRIARQSHGERMRVHGPILPAVPGRSSLRAAERIVVLVALGAAAWLLVWVVARGLAALAGLI